MNFSIPVNEEQTRIRLVKKEEMASRKEASKALVTSTPGSTAGAGSSAGTEVPPVGAHPIPTVAVQANGAPISAQVLPAPKLAHPKVQLVEVESGIYDIYFTCSCCEQYVIRCESIEKAAAAPPPAS